MRAAMCGHLECTRVLAPLEKEIQDKDRRTALMWSAWRGYFECVKILAPLE